MKALAISLALVLAIIIGSVSVYVSTYNTVVDIDVTTEQQWKMNRNELSTTATMIQELLGVKKSRDDSLINTLDAIMGGRYGADGSKAMMQWIQEAQVPYDHTMDQELFNIIAGRRANFEFSQNLIIEKQTQYTGMLKRFPSNVIMAMMGYDKSHDILTKYKFLTNKEVDQDFEKGEMRSLIPAS